MKCSHVLSALAVPSGGPFKSGRFAMSPKHWRSPLEAPSFGWLARSNWRPHHLRGSRGAPPSECAPAVHRGQLHTFGAPMRGPGGAKENNTCSPPRPLPPLPKFVVPHWKFGVAVHTRSSGGGSRSGSAPCSATGSCPSLSASLGPFTCSCCSRSSRKTLLNALNRALWHASGEFRVVGRKTKSST